MIVIKFLKLLFCFKKPVLINFSYINVLVKEKPTLFIVWDINNVWSVKLIPLKRKYHTAKNALVVSIPQEHNQITFTAANFWRKKSIQLVVQTVELDKATVIQLINGFRPLSKVEVFSPVASRIKSKAIIKPLCVKQKSSLIKKIDRFNINIQPFIYP